MGNASTLAFTTNCTKLLCSEVYCKIRHSWEVLEDGDIAEGQLLGQ